MSVDQRDLYEIVLEGEQELSDSYDSLPPATSDIHIEVSGEEAQGGVMIDYSEQAIYLDPSITYMNRERVETMTEFGIKHLRWHPNHGLAFRTPRFERRNFYGSESVSEYQPVIMGEEIDSEPEQAVHDIYRGAVQQFKNLFDTDFAPPDLIIDEDVMERSEVRDEMVPVGYEIDAENNQVVLNSEIIDDLHPQLLNEDFRYMIKRYHDLSAEQAVRQRVIPYAESLRPEAELQVGDVIFKDLDGSTIGAYNPEQQRMKIDYSLLPGFNPVTGRFTEGDGESTLLHEGVHDLDFSVNQLSRDYLSSVSDTDTDDPRNAVLEAPTTFEVFMAGWDNRPAAIEAFRDPLSNREFFRDYPAREMTSSENDSIAYPYNMGLITSLSIHEAMINDHGLEEGTDRTRDILYGNAWDLEHMGRALESAFERRDVPNIPLHRREVTEIVDEGEERMLEEAERLIEEIDGDSIDELVRGRELVHEYEQRNSFSNPPEMLDDLDRIVFQLSRRDERL